MTEGDSHGGSGVKIPRGELATEGQVWRVKGGRSGVEVKDGISGVEGQV